MGVSPVFDHQGGDDVEAWLIYIKCCVFKGFIPALQLIAPRYFPYLR